MAYYAPFYRPTYYDPVQQSQIRLWLQQRLRLLISNRIAKLTFPHGKWLEHHIGDVTKMVV